MTTATFSTYEDGVWELLIPVPPVPAARPRVGRWGTYYPKSYAGYRAAVEASLDGLPRPKHVTTRPVKVAVYVVAHRPKRPAKEFPRGDLDNYVKGALDAVTKSSLIWLDDVQVTVAYAQKRYAHDGEPPHTFILVTQGDHLIPMKSAMAGEDVYHLPADARVSFNEEEHST